MKSTACTIFSRIIRSHTVLVVVIIIVYTHLYVTKKDEKQRKKSDHITKIANAHCAQAYAAI